MKLASYNIQSGGFNAYGYELEKPERLDVLCEAVTKIGADFIALIDTFRWDEIFSEKNLRDLFGYKSVYCINLNDDRLRKIGHNNGITVMSNEVVEMHETISLETRDAVKTRLVFEGKECDIFSVYLDDVSEDTRLNQVKKLFSYFRKSVPTIMMGDLNSISRDDLESLDKFLTNNSEIKAKLGLRYMVEDFRRCEVIDLIESKGLLDASIDRETTWPNRLSPLEVDRAFARLDYAFYTPDVRVKNFRVLKDGVFQKVSDHFPIVFEVE